jgi:hypothetical protein
MVIQEVIKKPSPQRSKSTRKPLITTEEYFSISQKLLNDLSPSYKPEQSGFFYQKKYSLVVVGNPSTQSSLKKCAGHGTCCCVCGCGLCLSNNYILNRRFQLLPAPQTIEELLGINNRPSTFTSTICSSTCCETRISVPLRFLL